MDLINFLNTTKQSINAFAGANKLPATTVWRATIGKTVRPHNAKDISEATGGAVTVMELLFPKERKTT
jgi:hypothetical protein